MRKFTHHSRPAFCNPFPLTSPFPKKRSPLSTLDTLPSFRLWMISSMLSASKPPRKHTHYENKILVWGPITELKLRLGRRQLPSGNGIREPAGLMGTVTERLARGVPATAKPDSGPASQAKRSTLWIKNLKVAFYADGTVVIDSDLRGRHFS